MRQKIMCLISIDTHSRDVVIRLINEHVRKQKNSNGNHNSNSTGKIMMLR